MSSTRKYGSRKTNKLQRWIDLLAALLSRQVPATLDELRQDIPGYGTHDGPALERMFERDKDELRTFGVPIESVSFGDPPRTGYRLRPSNFYLLFAAITTQNRPSRAPVEAPGYRGLARLAFEPEEVQALAESAQRVRALGDPQLATDADWAMWKLTFDLPAETTRTSTVERVLTDPVDAKTFAVLGSALVDRKRVRFTYHAMSTNVTKGREVEPYGLVFVSNQWYLVARDTGHDQLRTFRLCRMGGLTANPLRPQSPDYDIPNGFRLEDHAHSRGTWLLGDEPTVDAIVEFRANTGATVAAAKLGRPVRGVSNQRRFEVRRADAFARWLLAFGGDAMPVQPDSIVDLFNQLARATLGRYEPHEQ